MSATYQTTLSLSEEDFQLKEQLRKKGYTIIEVWRYGAKKLIANNKKSKLTLDFTK